MIYPVPGPVTFFFLVGGGGGGGGADRSEAGGPVLSVFPFFFVCVSVCGGRVEGFARRGDVLPVVCRGDVVSLSQWITGGDEAEWRGC